MHSFERNPLTHGRKILHRKTRVLDAVQREDFAILACTVLTRLKGVTDRQKNGHLDNG